MTSVYIAGPMRGIKDFNFDAFYDAEVEVHNMFAQCGETILSPDKALPTDLVELWGITPGVIGDSGRKCGVTIFNPARRDHETYGPDVNKSETGDLADLPEFDLREALAADLGWIAENATHIYLLDGWENSKGAQAEKALAEALGLTVLYQTEPTVTEGDARDWEEFWEDTTGVDQDALPDYDSPEVDNILAVNLDRLFGPYASAVRKAETLRQTEVRTVSSTGGEKGVKPARFDLIPAKPLWTVAELYGRGAEKYADRNWEKGYEWSKSYGAMLRHASLFWQGQDDDEETGLPHLASVVFHALAMMEWSQTHPEFDNRPKG